MIGRVDIRTVKEFLEKPGVESITIYEIDEVGFKCFGRF